MASVKKNADRDRVRLRAVGEHIKGLFVPENEDPQLFEASGTPMATQKFADGTFKNKPVELGQEFFMNETYVGKSGKLIFMFRPVDSREYEHIEVDERQVLNIFPTIGAMAVGALGWAASKTDMLMSDIVSVLYDSMEKAEKEQKVAEKAQQETKYADVPNFGRF